MFDRKAYQKKYYRDHKKKFDSQAADYKIRKTKEMRAQAISMLGGKCVRCGFTDARALQLDHINGGGRRDESKHNRYSYYIHILADGLKGFQLLCANCNWIKRYEREEFYVRPRPVV